MTSGDLMRISDTGKSASLEEEGGREEEERGAVEEVARIGLETLLTGGPRAV